MVSTSWPNEWPLPHASTDADELQLESEAVLEAIEVQHGLLPE